MSIFVLDTTGNQDLLGVNRLTNLKYDGPKKRKFLQESPQGLADFATDLLSSGKDEEKQEYDFFGLPPPSIDISNIIANTLSITRKQPSKVEQKMDHIMQKSEEAFLKKDQSKPKMKYMIDLDHSDFNDMTGKRDELQEFKTSIDKQLANTEMVPNLEQLKELPSITKNKQRELNRIERSKTKGKDWFNMPATELTEERENDLKILQMRSVLNPKHFYKKNDLKVLPKYFQIGTVQHSPLDYFHERDTRRNKKRTLVDELLADTEAQKYIKRKHKEIMITKQKYAHRKAMNKMKKLKKNKK